MRLLVLVLNILVGSSLLAQSTEILAASMDSKAHKNNHQRGHATRLRGKSKDPRSHPVKQKRSENPGDVWERIRSGMQIPRPSPVQTLPDQALAKTDSLFESSVIQTFRNDCFILMYQFLRYQYQPIITPLCKISIGTNTCSPKNQATNNCFCTHL